MKPREWSDCGPEHEPPKVQLCPADELAFRIGGAIYFLVAVAVGLLIAWSSR